MSHVLGEAGRAFGKAFLAFFLVALIGVSQQNDLHGAIALGIAALAGSIAAGLSAAQALVPDLSFRAYLGGVTGAMLDSFTHAFLAAFLVSVIGWLQEPNYSTWHAFIIGAITGAVTAGLRALQGLGTHGEEPAPARGLRVEGGYQRLARRNLHIVPA